MAEPTNRKKLILNAFVMNTPGHLSPGLWKHPESQTDQYKDLSFWIDLAQLLDKHHFHGMFLADTLGPYDVYKGPANVAPSLASAAQFPVNDPLYLVPALAAVTKNLIFGVTASTTYEQPYSLARRFTTVDHLAKGRVAWNIVTSYLDSAARNHGLKEQIPHDERYNIADEYLEVLYKLWEGSWRDGAVVADREKGIYIEEDGVRQVLHEGRYFKVPGPHLCEPSPQRTPLLFQAGASKAGAFFGAKHGEAIFVGGQQPEALRKSIDGLRELARENGRDPTHLKFIAAITVVVAETDEKAQAKYEEYLTHTDKEGALALFGGFTGVDMSKFADDEDFRYSGTQQIQSIVHRWSGTVPGTNDKWNKKRIADYLSIGGMAPKAIGSAKTVADEIERWVEIGDVDGFNLISVTNPGSFKDIIQHLLPELQQRGLFRTDVEREGLTAREVFFGSKRLLDDHPGSQFKWFAGQAAPDYQKKN